MSRASWLAFGLALGLGLGTGAPLLAIDKFVAVGDSITAGSSFPSGCGICPVVFDCTGGCAASVKGHQNCGYVRRLESWLGAGYDVLNEGVGGEDTGEALMAFSGKLDPHCASPGDCIAVVLMHGTNDMGSSGMGEISPESARDNMAAMIDMAKARNIDVLLMSIVRRVYDWDNTKWADYRTLITALAGTKSLPFVDPAAQLCNNNYTCYNRNYWVDMPPAQSGPTDCTAPGEGDVNGGGAVGHLDPDGYDILTDRIKLAFPASLPAAPSPTSPSGDTYTTTPDFVWPEVPTARWYKLEVDGSSVTWWEAAAICTGGTCTANPGVSLGGGMHSWRVQARNLRGLGAWSATQNFTPTVPPVPVPTGPTGELFESAPTYEWTEAPGATSYDLRVKNGGGPFLWASAVPASVCTSGRCSYVEGTVLTPDNDTFQVRSRNGVGASAYSQPGVAFTILACSDPSQKDLEELLAQPVSSTEVVKHCGPLTAGAMGPYTVEVGGDLTVQTRDGFTALDGFTVEGAIQVKSP